MTALVDIALANAVLATVLGVVVWLATRVWQRPDVVWLLWLLVLAKLLSPPLVVVPWQSKWLASEQWPIDASGGQETSLEETGTSFQPESLQAAVDAPSTPAARTASRGAKPLTSTVPARELPSSPARNATAPVATMVDGERSADSTVRWPQWRVVIAGLWLAGSTAWFALAVLRMTSFARLLRHAEPAPCWLETETREVALRLGWHRPVLVKMVRRPMAPLVWRMFWRTTILLPADLLAALAPEARGTLLAHELAHATKPVVIRWLELAAIAVYWWHPVAWWARRELEQAEELCCDARVLSLFPSSARMYAGALLTTLDFVALDGPAAPIGARAFSQRRQITRRLAMILSNRSAKLFSWRSKAMFVALGLAMWPWTVAPVAAAPSSAIALVVDATLSGADIKTLEARLDRLEKMVQTLTTEVQAMRKDKADDAPAKVVETVPKTGAKDVDPNLKEIRVTFSKDMHDGTWSWTQSSRFAFPESAGDIHYEADERTCVMPVKLEPGKTYWIGLNSPKFHNFKDKSGRPSVPYELKFTTKAE